MIRGCDMSTWMPYSNLDMTSTSSIFFTRKLHELEPKNLVRKSQWFAAKPVIGHTGVQKLIVLCIRYQ